MKGLPLILLALYLLAMMGAGWRLFAMPWPRGVKLAAAIALVCPVPLLFILPGIMQHGEGFADILVTLGLTLLACGALCFGSGMGIAWYRARGR